jgi:hypothetical protein
MYITREVEIPKQSLTCLSLFKLLEKNTQLKQYKFIWLIVLGAGKFEGFLAKSLHGRRYHMEREREREREERG